MSKTRLLPPVAIDKTPLCCPDASELQAGDILIFNINQRQTKPNAHPTVFGQRMLNNQGGHKDAVHTGFVAELEGKKRIVHLRATGFSYDEVDTIKTLTHVYRPRILTRSRSYLLPKTDLRNRSDSRVNPSVRLQPTALDLSLIHISEPTRPY